MPHCQFTLLVSSISQILNASVTIKYPSSTSVSAQLIMCGTLWQRVPVSSTDHLHCWGHEGRNRHETQILFIGLHLSLIFPRFMYCVFSLLIYTSIRPNIGIRGTASNIQQHPTTTNGIFHQLSQLYKSNP